MSKQVKPLTLTQKKETHSTDDTPCIRPKHIVRGTQGEAKLPKIRENMKSSGMGSIREQDNREKWGRTPDNHALH